MLRSSMFNERQAFNSPMRLTASSVTVAERRIRLLRHFNCIMMTRVKAQNVIRLRERKPAYRNPLICTDDPV